ncbi:uncharacterized protein [Diadema antillarum]|uniref:uncharacterized protein n=1 Tax=Diadema antillarum TaxID=105358 RepID=UPI003A8884F9
MASDSYSNLNEVEFVPVLIRYGQHAKKKCLPKGVGKSELQECCKELFPEAESYFLQVHDDDFNQWMDLDDTFTIDKKTVIQMLGEQKEARPTKRQASGSPTADEKGKSLLQAIQAIKKFKSNHYGQHYPARKENARSFEKTFQMGWLHFSPKRRGYVQVKTMKGGGSPILRLRREATKEDLIALGKNTFFPNGHSQMGALKDMVTELADFGAKPINEEGWTLGSSSGAGVKLRLYLLTKLKDESCSKHSSDTVTGRDVSDPELSAGPSTTASPVNDGQETGATDFQSLEAAISMQSSTSEDLGTEASATEVQAPLTGAIASGCTSEEAFPLPFETTTPPHSSRTPRNSNYDR